MHRTYDDWKTTELDPFQYDDPPEQWVECEACDGYGYIAKRISVYEPGCGFPHDDTQEVTCEACNGAGGRIEEIDYHPPR
jgi:DnaJ-class molecular chaperone